MDGTPALLLQEIFVCVSGLVVTNLVCVFVFPVRSTEQLERSVLSALKEASEFMRSMCSKGSVGNTEALEIRPTSLQKQLEDGHREWCVSGNFKTASRWRNISYRITAIVDCLVVPINIDAASNSAVKHRVHSSLITLLVKKIGHCFQTDAADYAIQSNCQCALDALSAELVHREEYLSIQLQLEDAREDLSYSMKSLGLAEPGSIHDQLCLCVLRG
jgi:hypothetical protein